MVRNCALIVSMTEDGVIGLGGGIPWHYSADLKRFKTRTLNSTIIMGRKTWESLPRKPLPERQNIVVSTREGLNCERYPTVSEALDNARHEKIWFIGGAGIYEEAIDYCMLMDITLVPDTVEDPAAVRFPDIDWNRWTLASEQLSDTEHGLVVRTYTRVSQQQSTS